MRKPLLATILVLAWLSPSLAQNNFVTPGGSEVDGKVIMCLNGLSQAVPCPGHKPLGYCQLSITVATALTSCGGGVPAGATLALITIETNAVRWRDDGVAPTASVGWPLGIAVPWGYTAALTAIQFIPQTGTSVVNVSFYQ